MSLSNSGLITAFLVLILTACTSPARNASPAPLARQITQSPYCGLSGPGVAYVKSSDELDRFLGVSGQNLTTAAIRSVSFDREQLVFVTLGQQPTAGFSVGLRDANATGDTLLLDMAVITPEPDAMVAQVITTPCAVLAVSKDKWQRLEVTGLSDRPLIKIVGT